MVSAGPASSVDELLDHDLRLELGAGLVLGGALLLQRGEELLGGAELVLLGDRGELGVDVLVGDLDAPGLGLLGQQLGVDEVVGGLLLQRGLVGRLAAHLLGLHRRLLELGLVDRRELVLGHLLAVDLGHDVGDPLELGRRGLLVAADCSWDVESAAEPPSSPPQAVRASMAAAMVRPRTVRVRFT